MDVVKTDAVIPDRPTRVGEWKQRTINGITLALCVLLLFCVVVTVVTVQVLSDNESSAPTTCQDDGHTTATPSTHRGDLDAPAGARLRVQKTSSASTRPLICILSSGISNVDQIPSGHCTHLVYLGFRHVISTNSFAPKKRIIFDAFQALSSTTKLFMGVQKPSLEAFANKPHYMGKFINASVFWLPKHSLQGVAFMQYHTGATRFKKFAHVVQAISSSLRSVDLEVMLGVTVHSAKKAIAEAAVLKSIFRHVNYLILETHYHSLNETCRTTCPTVYDDSRSLTTLVSILTAVQWIQSFAESGSVCFSVSLSSHWFIVHQGAPKIATRCIRHEQASYKTICAAQGYWQHEPDLDGSLCDYKWTTGRFVSYDSASLLAVKVQNALEAYPVTPCVAVYNVDLDDYDGTCPKGIPFKRLQAVRRAQIAASVPRVWTSGETAPSNVSPIQREGAEEKARNGEGPVGSRCMPSAKDPRRPLICIIYQKPGRQNIIPRDTCTHVVYVHGGSLDPAHLLNIPTRDIEDVADAEYYLFLAVDHTVLHSKSAASYSFRSSQLLKSVSAKGLAVLDVSIISPSLHANAVIKQLGDDYHAIDLCLMMSVELFDLRDRDEILLNNIQYIAQNLDFLVFKTHYDGQAGLCRVTPVSTYDPMPDLCIPVTSVKTALAWMHAATPIEPWMCISLDMRVARYFTCEDVCLNSPCIEEDSIDYSNVCPEKNDMLDITVDGNVMSNVKAINYTMFSYEETQSLENKVWIARALFTNVCVVAVNPDLDDPHAKCSAGRFLRVKAIRHALDDTVQSPTPTESGRPGQSESETTSSLRPPQEAGARLHSIERDTTYGGPHGSKHSNSSAVLASGRNGSYGASVLQGHCLGNCKPFVCVLRSFWKYGVEHILRQPCTHIVLEIFNEDSLELSDALDMTAALTALHQLVSNEVDKRRFLLSRVRGFPLQVPLQQTLKALADVAKNITACLAKYNLDGIALLDVIGNSLYLQTISSDVTRLRAMIPNNKTMVLAVQVTDFYTNATIVASRLTELLRTADIVIFMAHFHRLWKFCRTWPPSVFASNYTCQPTTPLTTVTRWMQMVEILQFGMTGTPRPLPPMCISFNLAVLRFNFVGRRHGHGNVCDPSVEYIDYSQVCNDTRMPRLDPLYNTTRYKVRGNVWDAYEDEELLAAKIAKLVGSFPQLCLASFNTDADFNSKQCRSQYPRLTRMAEFAGYPIDHNASSEASASARKNIEASVELSTPLHKIVPRKGVSFNTNPVVCIIVGPAEGKQVYPRRGCTHFVFADEDTRAKGLPSRGTSWETFLEMRRSLSPYGVMFLLSMDVSKDLRSWESLDILELFLKDSVEWLLEYRLHGYALLGLKIPSAKFASLGNIMQLFHTTFSEYGLMVVLGISLPDYDPEDTIATERLATALRNADMVIFETHTADTSSPCKFTFPSSLEDVTDSSTAILTAASWMKAFEGTNSQLCFSVGLHVFLYELSASEECRTKKLGSYDQICVGSHRRDETLDRRVQSSYQVHGAFSATYDTEYNVGMKVSAALEKFPAACIAAYAVNYDARDCKNDSFTRFYTIVDALRIERTYNPSKTVPETTSTVTAGAASASIETGTPPSVEEASAQTLSPVVQQSSTMPPGEPQQSNSLVCILYDGFETADMYPRQHCDYLIFTDVVFDEAGSTFVPQSDDEVSFKTFLGLQTHVQFPLLAAVNEAETLDVYVPQWENDTFAEAFAMAAVRWLRKVGLNGLAFVDIFIGPEDMDSFLVMLEGLKASFVRQDPPLLLVFGAHIAEIEELVNRDSAPLHQIAKAVDVMIIETHHARIQHQCHVVPPSPFTEGGVEIAKALRKSTTQRPPTICVSVSMAKLKFSFVDESGNCSKEEWIAYDQACNLDDVPQNETDVYLVSKDDVLAFDNERTLQKKVKDSIALDPLICVAAYYVDLEDNTGFCDVHKVPFRRLETTWKTLHRVV
ncbi:uncharacterized protein LOC135388174 isoform X2 [Ornithodoros turicata]|uniref:uncharacterized protein LOC135388174 isoform X2 n=1 Tax=Ornithodoros turicata TaxID=34597 RepID=UPI003139B466